MKRTMNWTVTGFMLVLVVFWNVPMLAAPRKTSGTPAEATALHAGKVTGTIIDADGKTPARNITIKVYDVSGREVRTLVDADMEPGRYQETLDAAGLAGGVYFARMTADDYTETKKLVLLK